MKMNWFMEGDKHIHARNGRICVVEKAGMYYVATVDGKLVRDSSGNPNRWSDLDDCKSACLAETMIPQQ